MPKVYNTQKRTDLGIYSTVLGLKITKFLRCVQDGCCRVRQTQRRNKPTPSYALRIT